MLFKRTSVKNNSRNYNLILISIDTLRSDHMGVYGYGKNTTPNIDKWAKDASVYTQAYTIYPITLQSFYTLFSGKDSFIKLYKSTLNYVNSWESIDNKEKIKTLPKILNEHGYVTSAFITNPVLGSIATFFKYGFNYFNFIDTSYSTDKEHIASYTHDYQNAISVTNQAIDWIKGNKDNKFFLWLHYTTPHYPYTPPIEYLCKITEDCHSNKYETLLSETSPYMKTILESCQNRTSKQIVESAQNLYDAEISTVDAQVGEVFNEIKKLKLDKNTIILFYGDHGEGFDHDIYGHGVTLYNSAIHIPFIIRSPEYIDGKVVNKIIDNTDILPSILDLLHIKYSKNDFSGTSFINSNSLEKLFQSQKKYLYFFTTLEKNTRFAVYDGDYKYIYSKDGSCLYQDTKEELYDLKNDSQELNNIINIDKNRAKLLKEILFKEFNTQEYLFNSTDNLEIKKILRSLGY